MALRDRKGALLLVGDYAAGGQFQPGQMAADKLVITPILPEGAQAFEITPGEVKVLTPERVPGGRRITMEEFDTTSLILCTGDLGLYERVRVDRRWAPSQGGPARDRAGGDHAQGGHRDQRPSGGRRPPVPLQGRSQDAPAGWHRAGAPGCPRPAGQVAEAIKNAREAQERQDYALAWAEARRAKRPLRIVMSGHWDQAWAAFTRAAESINPEGPKQEDESPSGSKRNPKVKLDAPLQLLPIACPPVYLVLHAAGTLTSGSTGSREGRATEFGPNRVPSGNFDDPEAVTADGWVDVSYQMEGIVCQDRQIVSRAEANGKEIGKNKPNRDQLSPGQLRTRNRVVKLKVAAENQDELDTILPKFFDFPVAAIRSPPIPVEANNLIRISVLVKRPYLSPGGLGGIIVRDSIGGEQFQFRTSGPTPFVFARRSFPQGACRRHFHRHPGTGGLCRSLLRRLPRGSDRGGPCDPATAQRRQRRRGQSNRSPGLPDSTRAGRRGAAHQHATAVVDPLPAKQKKKGRRSPPAPPAFRTAVLPCCHVRRRASEFGQRSVKPRT